MPRRNTTTETLCTTESATAAIRTGANADHAMGEEIRKACLQLQNRDDTGLLAFLNVCESDGHGDWVNHTIRAVNYGHKIAERKDRAFHIHAKGKAPAREFSVDFKVNGKVPKTKFDANRVIDTGRNGKVISFKALKPVRVAGHKTKVQQLKEFVDRMAHCKDEDAKALALKMLEAIKTA